MKKIDFKSLIITVMICLLPILFGVSIYDKLPEQVAVHFNFNNEPNNFMPKGLAVFLIPFILAVFQIILCVVTDISDDKKEENKKFTKISKMILPVIDIVVYVSIMMYALNEKVNIQLIVCFIIGFLLLILGNYLPKYEPNSIETKKFDREFLRKENKILGYVFVILGILWILGAFSPNYIALIILAITLVLSIVFTSINLYLWKKQKTKNMH